MQNRRGFTLIELLVVIAIIGLLATVILAALGQARMASRDARRLSDAKQIVNALDLYAAANGGVYPVTPTALSNCSDQATCVGGLQAQLAPYLPKLPSDPSYANMQANYRYWACSTTNPTQYSILVYREAPVVAPDTSPWCNVRHGSNKTKGGAGEMSCWMTASGGGYVPTHGWCD